MKTPLSRVYVDEGCVNALTMSGLMVEQRKRGREIRMIIDLTNHDCLYEDEIPPGGDNASAREKRGEIDAERKRRATSVGGGEDVHGDGER